MCFDYDSLPPNLPAGLGRAPMAGGAGAELLELVSADGTTFSAALAESPQSSGPGVVILPDVRACIASTASWPNASPRRDITRL